MDQERFNILFEKYLRNSCSKVEFEELLSFFDSLSVEQQEVLKDQIARHFTTVESDESSLAERNIFDLTEKNLLQQIGDPSSEKIIRSRRFLWTTIAAACLILIFSALFFYKNTVITVPQNATQLNHVISTDVKPGKEQATLTLGSGRSIELEGLREGQVLEAEGVKIIKAHNGQLKYEFANKNIASNISHTISTPKGGRYQLTLSDGSSVWLNSSSSLTFPASFTANTREVHLKGEGFFDVAKNKEKPFIVHLNRQTVEVTGTRFNISGYEDDNRTVTTLVEGQVIVNNIGNFMEKAILKPGQQSVLNQHKVGIKVISANLEEALSWKNGWFVFENMTLKEILKKASRWYEIEIDFATIPHSRYSGAVPMDVNLSRLLEILEKTGDVSFEVKNKVLTVKNKPM